MKTLLLTGGTGYIGSHCAVAALEAGYKIVILDNLSNSNREVVESIESITGKKIEFSLGDIRNQADIEVVFAKHTIDTVMHFAGLKAVGESCEQPFEYYDNNVLGTKNLCEIMEKHKVKNIIFSSSATVYDPMSVAPFTEDTLTGNTSNPYGTSKFIIEQMLRDLAVHKDFRVVNLRYFNPIGAHKSGLIGENPHDIPNNLLPYIMKVAVGELPELGIFGDDYETSDGTGVRDYIHVVDLAEGHIAALHFLKKIDERGRFETFNLGTGDGTSVLEMIEISREITDTNIPTKILPKRAGDIAIAYCNPDRAHKILEWKTHKTVEQAIADSWNYIQKQQ